MTLSPRLESMESIYEQINFAARIRYNASRRAAGHDEATRSEPTPAGWKALRHAAYKHGYQLASHGAVPASAVTTAAGLIAGSTPLVAAGAVGVGLMAACGAGHHGHDGHDEAPARPWVTRVLLVLDQYGLLGMPEYAAYATSQWADANDSPGLQVASLAVAIGLRAAIQLPRALGISAFCLFQQLPMALMGVLYGTIVWLRARPHASDTEHTDYRPTLFDGVMDVESERRRGCADVVFGPGNDAVLREVLGLIGRLRGRSREFHVDLEQSMHDAGACTQAAEGLIAVTESMKALEQVIAERRKSREASVRLWAQKSLAHHQTLCKEHYDVSAAAMNSSDRLTMAPLARALRHVLRIYRFYLRSFKNLERRLLDDSVRRIPLQQLGLFYVALQADQAFGKTLAHAAHTCAAMNSPHDHSI